MTREIPVEVFVFCEKVIAVLDTEKDPVKQQMVIELLTARHALKCGKEAAFVVNSMNKHVRQLLDSAWPGPNK